MLNDKGDDGEYKIPFLVVCDAFQSEMTAFADLVLPDTTYLERHDVMSMLDRPISEFDGPVDSVRVPVVPPTGECKPFQEVLIELACRLKFPAFTKADGSRKFRDYPDFIVNFETEAGSGIGFLAGWRGEDGTQLPARRAEPAAVGDVRQEQLRLPLRAAEVLPVHAQLEPGLHGMGAAHAAAPLRRAGADPAVLRRAAELPPRRAGQAAGPAAAGASARAHRAPTSTRCRSVSRRSRRRPPTCRRTRWPRSRSGRWRCTTRGTRRTRGCARSTPTTTCSSTRRPRSAAGIADGGWMLGRDRSGARCAACAATPRRSSRARCGPGTPSARRRAHGSWRPTPTRRGGASC